MDEAKKCKPLDKDPGILRNFDQHATDGIDLGASDSGSIMHGPRDTFTQNGDELLLGTRTGFQRPVQL
jgi:hypothetical protein